MKLPVEQLKDTLLAVIEQLRDTVCEAESKGLATVDVDDEITVSVELISSGGMNAISRVTTSKAGEQVKREIVPKMIETTNTGEEVTTQVSGPTTVTEESTQEHAQKTDNGTGGGDTVKTDQTIEAL